MIDFGIVKPGTTLYIPFASYAGSTGASATLTGLATTDIEIYKDGGTTQRASDSGYALLDTDGIDFDGTTGIHGFSIDLADNTTAGFYAAGSQYFVVISSVTVDSQTVNFIAARFTIGYPSALLNTTIATLSSQTSFTLTAGPAEDDVLNGMELLIHDVASAVQISRAIVTDYTGSTKTVSLVGSPFFTIAAGDNIAVLGLAALAPTAAGRTLDVTTTGEAGIDWGNIGNPTTSIALSGTTVATATNVTTVNGLAAGVITASAVATGAIDADALAADAGTEIGTAVWATAARTLTAATNVTSTGAAVPITAGGLVSSDVTAISTDTAAADNLELAFDDTAGAVPWLGILDQGTAQSATGTTLVLRAASAFADNVLIGSVVMVYGSTQGYWQVREITDYDLATDTITVDTWTVTPSGTITYKIFAGPPALSTLPAVNVTQLGGDSQSLTDLKDFADAGYDPSTNKVQGLVLADAVTIVNGLAANVITAAATAADFGAEVADAVWDEAIAGHVAAGSTGEALNAAGGAGDPWITSLPGSYTSGQAGYILGTNLNATVSSRLASASYTAPLDAAGTRTAVGLASANLDTQLGTIDTNVDLILADTGTDGVVVAAGSKSGYTISGTITTLDALDTAQDSQHSTTQAAVAAVQADLPQRITKNTALAGFMFFMVQSADHVTGATGLTVTATRSLDGAAFASCANAVSEVSNGWYKIDLAAGDLNGNVVALKFTAATADARMITIVTQPT